MDAVEYYRISDTVVGLMIEGSYGWNEYCQPCSASYLAIHPDRKHRSVSISEATTSWRNFTCYSCRKLLGT